MSELPSKFYVEFAKEECAKLGIKRWFDIIKAGLNEEAAKRVGELIKENNKKPSKLSLFFYENGKWAAVILALKHKKTIDINYSSKAFFDLLNEYVETYPEDMSHDLKVARVLFRHAEDENKKRILEMMTLFIKGTSACVSKHPEIFKIITPEEKKKRDPLEAFLHAIGAGHVVTPEDCANCDEVSCPFNRNFDLQHEREETPDSYVSSILTEPQRLYVV